MGHVGLTPQTATALGGFKAQGKTADGAAQIAEEALALQAAGCFAIVFEAVPAAITELLVPRALRAGDRDRRRPGDRRPGARLARPARDLRRPQAKFVKRFAELRERDDRRRRRVRAEVRARSFPGPEHVYSVDPEELEAFRRYLNQESLARAEAFGGDWSATEI